VKDVRIATQDPNPEIAGKGIEILRSNGVEIKCGILEDEAIDIIRPFTINMLQKRPYVILKWAQSKYGFIGKPNERIWLSHPFTNTWSHKKRSMADAIMVGSRTVMLDDPLLTTREYHGRSPHRVIYDPNGTLSGNFKVFNEDGNKVFYFSRVENKNLSATHIIKYLLTDQETEIDQVLTALFKERIGILLVEGGAYVHDLFVQQNAWDEAWVIRTSHVLNEGIEAPNLRGILIEEIELESDRIIGIRNEEKY
jgi:diaminohydroxyphosphoribosylaminopyrimidine deaminase/5-amino-6-(5-phosphoribosylamino)uracil reductase